MNIKFYFIKLSLLAFLLLLFAGNLFAQTTITLPAACSDCKSSSNGTAVVNSYGNSTCNAGTSGTLNGTYTAGQPVTTANIMTLYANVMTAGSWSISTTPNNGVTFSGSGTFATTGCQQITLTASGTPTLPGPLIAVTNTSPQGSAATTVQPSTNPSTNGTAIVTNYGNSICANPSTGTINGTMTAGVPVSGVTMSLYANVTTAGSWSLSATQNGVTFTGSGTFTTTGCQLINLNASGTPTTTGPFTWSTNSNPVGSAPSTVVAAFNPSQFASASAGNLSGKTCFDIALSNDNTNSCGPLSARNVNKSDFTLSSVNTQTYTFTPSGTVSNVRFQYVNTNGQVITGISGGNAGSNITNAVTATVSYNNNLNTLALGYTNNNPLTADIYVIFNDGTSDKILKLTANVKDCACCGAYVSATQFKEFMCWNLGADYTADPFTISPQIYGARYFWGQKTPYLTQTQDATYNGIDAGGTNSWTDWSENIKTANDPCPAGYRVPTSAQWEGVKNNNTLTYFGTWTNSFNNFSSYVKIGDLLLLPAAGQRTVGESFPYSEVRGADASYWTSTAPGTTLVNAFRAYKNGGTSSSFGRGINNQSLPIRCIKE